MVLMVFVWVLVCMWMLKRWVLVISGVVLVGIEFFGGEGLVKVENFMVVW